MSTEIRKGRALALSTTTALEDEDTPEIVTVADVSAEPLGAALEMQAQMYLDARRRVGQGTLDAARAVSEARASARHGQWGPWLERTSLSESAAKRLVDIHRHAQDDPRFAEAIRSGFLSKTVAGELVQGSDFLLEHFLTREQPPTRSEVQAAKRAANPPPVVDLPAPAPDAPMPIRNLRELFGWNVERMPDGWRAEGPGGEVVEDEDPSTLLRLAQRHIVNQPIEPRAPRAAVIVADEPFEPTADEVAVIADCYDAPKETPAPGLTLSPTLPDGWAWRDDIPANPNDPRTLWQARRSADGLTARASHDQAEAARHAAWSAARSPIAVARDSYADAEEDARRIVAAHAVQIDRITDLAAQQAPPPHDFLEWVDRAHAAGLGLTRLDDGRYEVIEPDRQRSYYPQWIACIARVRAFEMGDARTGNTQAPAPEPAPFVPEAVAVAGDLPLVVVEDEDGDPLVSIAASGLEPLIAEGIAQAANALRLLVLGQGHAVDTPMIDELRRAVMGCKAPARVMVADWLKQASDAANGG